MLAGKMKLKYFVMIAGVVGVIGLAALYYACGSQDDVVTAEDMKPKPTRAPPPPPTLRGAPVPRATPSPAQEAPPGPSERDVDRAVMRWAGKDLGSDKIKDASKGQPFKVNLYQDSGQRTMNRAKVDLDRDEKWDEKWTFDGASITRQVAPNDDESYTETYLWNGEAWAKQ